MTMQARAGFDHQQKTVIDRPLAPPPARSGSGTLVVMFGLLGALVAYGIMRMADTPWYDPYAFYAGVGSAAVLGALSSWAVQRLGRVTSMRVARWVLIPIAGAMVGMIVQAVPLRTPVEYYVVASGLTKADPITWVLVGIPLGGLPAIIVTFLLHLCLRATAARGRAPALDARERMIVPAVGTCLVLSSFALVMASHLETPVVLLIMLLSFVSLVEVVIRDSMRARWIARAFRGDGPFLIVPMREVSASDLPAFIGGVPGGAAIVRLHGETGYRSAAREPVAETNDVEIVATQPLKRRRLLAASFAGAAVLVSGAHGLVTFLSAIY